MSGMLGASAAQAPNEEQLLGKLETMKAMIEDVNRQFQDPVRARVRAPLCVWPESRAHFTIHSSYSTFVSSVLAATLCAATHDVHLRLHSRVLVSV